MSSLCEHNTESPWADVEHVLREDLGDGWQEAFSSFQQTPIKVGSIAQVHIAYLPSGEKVAVKV